MPVAALLAVGNELLNGEVQDKNLHTLARALTQAGIEVACAAVARDIPLRIADALYFLLGQKVNVLVCCGGLGPTQDDLTLAAIAQALHRPLRLSADALRLVDQHYARLLTQHHVQHSGPRAAREKMATLPQGATPLHNPVGTAPGVRLEHDGVLLYVLPGVPEEMEAMLAESVLPELHSRFRLEVWAEQALMVRCEDEATIAPHLRRVSERHPDVYLKSLARPFPAARREGLRIIAAARAPEEAQAVAMARRALDDLRQQLTTAGFVVWDA